MHEVFLHPEHSEWFLAAARGDADWDAIYEGYTATVDWPGAAFWRELAAAYPDAKVLLSVRDPQEWYESYCDDDSAADRRRWARHLGRHGARSHRRARLRR